MNPAEIAGIKFAFSMIFRSCIKWHQECKKAFRTHFTHSIQLTQFCSVFFLLFSFSFLLFDSYADLFLENTFSPFENKYPSIF